MLDDDCKAFKRLAICGDRSVISNTKVDVQFRQTAVDPAPTVLIRLQASAYERNRKTQRVLLLIAFGTAISKIVLVLLAREPGPTLLDPLLGVMAFGVYLLARFYGSIAPGVIALRAPGPHRSVRLRTVRLLLCARLCLTERAHEERS
jgi:hypothetical protein